MILVWSHTCTHKQTQEKEKNAIMKFAQMGAATGKQCSKQTFNDDDEAREATAF